eukprot:TRINITY_DN3526_c0_g1_i1.p1 TRINITY_DN3526_c0_g1~~TRINITY_DN3526_c0_g1_i1.p1  ORF type:complete len:761 (-),score=126.85 TRINITY_DN3526_c0_g1_i1:122-2404(-)
MMLLVETTLSFIKPESSHRDRVLLNLLLAHPHLQSQHLHLIREKLVSLDRCHISTQTLFYLASCRFLHTAEQVVRNLLAQNLCFEDFHRLAIASFRLVSLSSGEQLRLFQFFAANNVLIPAAIIDEFVAENRRDQSLCLRFIFIARRAKLLLDQHDRKLIELVVRLTPWEFTDFSDSVDGMRLTQKECALVKDSYEAVSDLTDQQRGAICANFVRIEDPRDVHRAFWWIVGRPEFLLTASIYSHYVKNFHGHSLSEFYEVMSLVEGKPDDEERFLPHTGHIVRCRMDIVPNVYLRSAIIDTLSRLEQPGVAKAMELLNEDHQYVAVSLINLLNLLNPDDFEDSAVLSLCERIVSCQHYFTTVVNKFSQRNYRSHMNLTLRTIEHSLLDKGYWRVLDTFSKTHGRASPALAADLIFSKVKDRRFDLPEKKAQILQLFRETSQPQYLSHVAGVALRTLSFLSSSVEEFISSVESEIADDIVKFGLVRDPTFVTAHIQCFADFGDIERAWEVYTDAIEDPEFRPPITVFVALIQVYKESTRAREVETVISEMETYYDVETLQPIYAELFGLYAAWGLGSRALALLNRPHKIHFKYLPRMYLDVLAAILFLPNSATIEDEKVAHLEAEALLATMRAKHMRIDEHAYSVLLRHYICYQDTSYLLATMKDLAQDVLVGGMQLRASVYYGIAAELYGRDLPEVTRLLVDVGVHLSLPFYSLLNRAYRRGDWVPARRLGGNVGEVDSLERIGTQGDRRGLGSESIAEE